MSCKMILAGKELEEAKEIQAIISAERFAYNLRFSRTLKELLSINRMSDNKLFQCSPYFRSVEQKLTINRYIYK